jgi:hypothetical protein
MLPDAGQVGKSQIDHLDVLVLDRLKDIVGRGTTESHAFPPAVNLSRMRFAALTNPLPRAQRERSFPLGRNINRGAAAGHSGAVAQCAQILSPSTAASALVRPLHQLQGRFDAPPNFGLFVFASLFEGASLLGSFSDGLVTVRFE